MNWPLIYKSVHLPWHRSAEQWNAFHELPLVQLVGTYQVGNQNSITVVRWEWGDIKSLDV